MSNNNDNNNQKSHVSIASVFQSYILVKKCKCDKYSEKYECERIIKIINCDYNYDTSNFEFYVSKELSGDSQPHIITFAMYEYDTHEEFYPSLNELYEKYKHLDNHIDDFENDNVTHLDTFNVPKSQELIEKIKIFKRTPIFIPRICIYKNEEYRKINKDVDNLIWCNANQGFTINNLNKDIEELLNKFVNDAYNLFSI